MRLTKYAHSCLRVEHDGGVLVVDPGMFSDPTVALDGVDAVLITHEHPDHLDVAAVRLQLDRQPFPIHGPASLAGALGDAAEALRPVTVGESFTAAGVAVRAYGGQHAVIHPDIPTVDNLGYLINDVVYHPGDALVVPEETPVDTLFAPIHAPWSKFSEVVDFIRAVAPRRAYALHDALLNDNGLRVLDRQYAAMSGTDYQRLEPGSRVDV
ncbi:L-ascorbate metabolism protein UlaG (beta-lactamase superfamily) [Micromonospora luteifusca]|uniref:L-ascorbate metabolism protein UlaG (Beta-lactamase superfamily) n=1 Tax=Micromonospora luteifusca TaxID=709860 RepID=A0ABS2LWC7_9ACTN|nr:MBL fold metallo-hydrolase [Micromonospora luteifusca]MBM7492445.1 L-ascorbate metabolism protein UlaG (beta-lactamase superfamily) [Micromonospora luteifusca]